MAVRPPHSELTRTRMRRAAAIVSKRPAIKKARSEGAKKMWAKIGKEEMGRRISEGWDKRRGFKLPTPQEKEAMRAEKKLNPKKEKMTREQKRAANIAAHMAKNKTK